MNFNEMYRVMIKQNGRFVGTGQTSAGDITTENNIIHQSFYTIESAEKLKTSLEEAGFEVKLKKGNKWWTVKVIIGNDEQ